ncbi:MAG: hypothetical protein Q9197_000803 [Variospora fuerteventurae]
MSQSSSTGDISPRDMRDVIIDKPPDWQIPLDGEAQSDSWDSFNLHDEMNSLPIESIGPLATLLGKYAGDWSQAKYGYEDRDKRPACVEPPSYGYCMSSEEFARSIFLTTKRVVQREHGGAVERHNRR